LKAGWVFSVRVIVDNPAIKTVNMIANINEAIRQLPDVYAVDVEEDYMKPVFPKTEVKGKVKISGVTEKEASVID